MVHKKFIKVKGKTYGPYYYESYREGGRVKKRYVKVPPAGVGGGKKKVGGGVKKVVKKKRSRVKVIQRVLVSVAVLVLAIILLGQFGIVGYSVNDSGTVTIGYSVFEDEDGKFIVFDFSDLLEKLSRLGKVVGYSIGWEGVKIELEGSGGEGELINEEENNAAGVGTGFTVADSDSISGGGDSFLRDVWDFLVGVFGGGEVMLAPSGSFTDDFTNLDYVDDANWVDVSWDDVNDVLSPTGVGGGDEIVYSDTFGDVGYGLIGLWHLNGNTVDDAGSNDGVLMDYDINNGDLNTPPQVTRAYFNQGYDFDGVDDAIFIEDGSSLMEGLPKLSISAWVKCDNIAINRRIVNKGNAVHLSLYQQKIRLQIYNNTGSSNFISSSFSIQQGAWYHVVGIFNGTGIVLYVNGVLQGYALLTGMTQSSNSPVMIGSYSAGVFEHWDGIIDEVGIWDRALSESEVIDLNNSGGGGSLGSFESVAIDAGFGIYNLNASWVESDSGVEMGVSLDSGGTWCDILNGSDLSGTDCEDNYGSSDFMYRVEFSSQSDLDSVRFDYTGEEICGNGGIDVGEVCDGTELNEETCESQLGAGWTGTLVCDGDCLGFDTGGCVEVAVCGDGVIDFGEECDDNDLENGDGCSSICEIESGSYCYGVPSECYECPGNCNGFGTEQDCLMFDDSCGLSCEWEGSCVEVILPDLALTGESVTPTTGDAVTYFDFRVNYMHTQDTAPEFVQLVINNGTDDLVYNMSKVDDGDDVYTDGVEYRRGVNLIKNLVYSFYFVASDGIDVVQTNWDYNLNVVNSAPVSHIKAGSAVLHGQNFVLESLSFDRDYDELSYSWEQTDGTGVSLSATDEEIVSFIAPNEDDTLTFQLTVIDDDGASSVSSVSVIVRESADIYYVDKDNLGGTCDDGADGAESTPLCTIQEAVSRVLAGDNVIVRGGTYYETVEVLNKAGTLGSPITFSAYSGEEVVIDGGQSNENVLWVKSSYQIKPISSYLIFDGFEFRNSNVSAVLVQSSSNIIIRNCEVHGAGEPGFHSSTSSGIILHGNVHNSTIEYCEVHDNAIGIRVVEAGGDVNTGLYCIRGNCNSFGTDNLIQYNYVHDNYRNGDADYATIDCGGQNKCGNAGDGIVVSGGIEPPRESASGNIVQYNVVENFIDDAIDSCCGSRNTLIRGNVVLKPDKSVDSNDMFQSGNGRGIKVSTKGYSTNHTVLGNVVINNTYAGTDEDPDGGMVEGNYYYHNVVLDSDSGIVIDHGGGILFGGYPSIRNNILLNNSEFDMHFTGFPNSEAGSLGVEHFSNNFFNSYTSGGPSPLFVWGDDWYNSGDVDYDSLSGNPMFVDYDVDMIVNNLVRDMHNSDFAKVPEIYLQEGSPAIDEGVWIEGVHCSASEEVGDCRAWYGLAPDIGAFEYAPVSGGCTDYSDLNCWNWSCLADVDGSGWVTVDDLTYVNNHLGFQCSFMNDWCEFADANRDGWIDMFDIGIVLNNLDKLGLLCDCTPGSCNVNCYNGPELCDGYDNNCGGDVDEDDVCLNMDYYCDNDGDGYFSNMITGSCDWLTCYDGCIGSQGDDCDDDVVTGFNINPSAVEVCDGLDNDCSGTGDDVAVDLMCDLYAGEACVTTTCEGVGGCNYTEAHTTCNDGAFCNGIEICSIAGIDNATRYADEQGCVVKDVPDVNDSIWCTDDSCDEVNDKVDNDENDTNCDSGEVCVAGGEAGIGCHGAMPNAIKFNGASTNFSAIVDIVDLKNVENATLEILGSGLINFTGTLDFAGLDLDSYVNIGDKRIEIDLSKPGMWRLNVSSRLMFYGVDFTEPELRRDGVNCTLCGLVSYSGGSYVSDVPGFSVYEVVDLYSSPPAPPGGNGDSPGSGPDGTPPASCTPIWSCGSYGECVDGLQTRTCFDLEVCGVLEGKPDVIRECGLEVDGEDMGEGVQITQVAKRWFDGLLGGVRKWLTGKVLWIVLGLAAGLLIIVEIIYFVMGKNPFAGKKGELLKGVIGKKTSGKKIR